MKLNNGFLKIRCLEVANTTQEAEELYTFVKPFEDRLQRSRLIDLYVNLGSVEKLKIAVQHIFPDGTTILEDFTQEAQLPEPLDTYQEQAQTAPKQPQLGDLEYCCQQS